MSTDRQTGLALLFADGPRVRDGLAWPTSSFSASGEVFVNTELGDWTGFYDWLRDTHGVLIGLRYWPFDTTAFLQSEVGHLPFIRTTPNGAIELFFSDSRDTDSAQSKDQGFQYDALFRSAEGTYALLIDDSELRGEDIESLGRRGLIARG